MLKIAQVATKLILLSYCIKYISITKVTVVYIAGSHTGSIKAAT